MPGFHRSASFSSTTHPEILESRRYDLNSVTAWSTVGKETYTRDAHVTVRVFDVLGRHVETLADGIRPPGSYEVAFDGTNIPSGQYIIRLDAPGFSQSRVVTLLK